MTWHLYLLPIIGSGVKGDARRPKYITNFNDWSMMDYGFQPVALAAVDIDDVSDASLSANADVQKIPDNLDQTIGAAALAIVQSALEDRNLPSQWVTQGITYRELLRTLYGFFSFVQRYATIANTTALLLGRAVTLNTQLNQLSAGVRQNLRDTATSLGLDISGLAGTTTIRAALKNVADQWGRRFFNVGGINI